MKKLSFLKPLILFIAFWLFLSFISGVMFSGFHLTDDCNFIRINNAIHQHGFWHTLLNKISYGLEIRLKPVDYIQRVIRIGVFGTNYTAHSVFVSFLGGITSFFLYLFAKKQKHSTFESISLPALTLWGLQSIVWFHLGYDEMFGMFFLSIALLFMLLSVNSQNKKLYNTLFVVFCVIFSYTKETFMLLLPAILFWKNALEKQTNNISWIQTIKNNKILNICLFIFLIADMLFLKFGIKVTNIGYAGFDGINLPQNIKTFWAFCSLPPLVLSIPVLIIILALIQKDFANFKKALTCFFKENLNSTILFFLIVVPQCLIYTKSGFYPRYLLPATLGSAILALSSIKALRVCEFQKAKRIIVYTFCVFVLLKAIIITSITAVNYANQGFLIHAGLREVVSATKPDSKILIVADTAEQYEEAQSVQTFLINLYGRKNVYFYHVASKNPAEYDQFKQNLTKIFGTTFKRELVQNISTADNFNTFIIFSNVEGDFINNTFNKNFNAKDFSRKNYLFFSVYEKKHSK